MSLTRIDFSDLSALSDKPSQPPAEKDAPRRGPGRWILRILWTVLVLMALLVAPFVILIRVGVVGYQEWGLGTWPALGLGVIATALLLSIYAWLLARRVGSGRTVRKLFTRGAALLVAAYAAHALLYVASSNVKEETIRTEYQALHPLLRVAVSTVILVDRDAMITDAGRSLEDYARMGLPPNEASLHLPQQDGRVHALDLRTVGRAEWRNRAVTWALEAMGFATLRHVGTADHLHVSLRLPAG